MSDTSFIKPEYNARCFADLPATIKYLLTGQGNSPFALELFGELPQRYDTVIFFFIDSFGWRFFEKYRADYPFLEYLTQEGVVSKLTSQFPSTTAAHVTCIHTGLPVGQSGVYEWQYYEPHLDTIITPLLFSFGGTKQRDKLKSTGIEPEKLYPTRTFYQDLKEHGVTSYIFQHREYTPSTYSDVVFAGAEVVPYLTLPEALVNMRQLLGRQPMPAYFFLYYEKIDAICHHYGPDSPQLEAEIDNFLVVMDRLFRQTLAGQFKNTLFILTADHGQIAVDPKTTIYLNREPRLAGFERFLKTNRKGELLIPAGSPRDMFLYIKEEMLDEVYKVADLIEQGYFGGEPVSPDFLARAGNLVILPYQNGTVWWYEKDKSEMKFYGHHGGLTRAEMEIPLILCDFPKRRSR
jgi:predicted AlkP superfamily pyrophosphatase or phosphodiesterase